MAISSSLEISLTRAAQVKKPAGEVELINAARPQPHITFLTRAMILQKASCVPPPSQQIQGISLRWSNMSRHGRIPSMMTGGATPNDWPKWLSQDYIRESGIGGWHGRDTVLVTLSPGLFHGPGSGSHVQGQAGARITHRFSNKWKLLAPFLLTLCIHKLAIYNTVSFLGLSTKQKCQIFMLSGGNSASYFGLMHILSSKTEIFGTWFFMADFPISKKV